MSWNVISRLLQGNIAKMCKRMLKMIMHINYIRCFVHILVKKLTDLTNSQNQREKYHFSIDK